LEEEGEGKGSLSRGSGELILFYRIIEEEAAVKNGRKEKVGTGQKEGVELKNRSPDAIMSFWSFNG